MSTLDYIIYALWILAPLFFIILILWAQLERWSGRNNRDDIGNFFRQALFLSACTIISIAVDKYSLRWIADQLEALSMPYLFYRLVLFPIVVFVLGKCIGGSKKIEVENNPLLKHSRDRRVRRK